MTDATKADDVKTDPQADAGTSPTTSIVEKREMDLIPFKQAMLPRSMSEGLTLATALAKSSLVPKDFQNNAANVFLAIQLGMELGLPPMQALQSIAVINGRATMWGDAVLALVSASGKLDWITEEFDESDPKNLTAVCEVARKGWPKPKVQTFSMEDAKAAGLATKQGPWQTYQRRMLQMRARGFALRDVFPDVLRGIITTEEAEDIPSVGSATTTEGSQFDAFVFDLGLDDHKLTELKTAFEAATHLTRGQKTSLLKKYKGDAVGLLGALQPAKTDEPVKDKPAAVGIKSEPDPKAKPVAEKQSAPAADQVFKTAPVPPGPKTPGKPFPVGPMTTTRVVVDEEAESI